MNIETVLNALGAPLPTDAHSLPLWTAPNRPVTISTTWSRHALDTAARRSTPLLVVTNDRSSPAPPDVRRPPWPVVAVADSPWAVASADLGLLVGASGPADHVNLDDSGAAVLARTFLDLAFDAEPRPPSAPGSLLDVVPFPIDQTYEAEDVLRTLVDRGEWLEFDTAGAAEVLTAVARIDGHSVGIAASRPNVLQGRLSGAACARVNRLVAWCRRGNRPFVSLVDTAGLRPFSDMAEVATITSAAADLRAAEVTKIVVVIGHAIGLGATVMGAVGARADVVLPWPRASYALASPSPDADLASTTAASAVGRAARAGDVMDIVHPDETRQRIVEMLGLLRGHREYGQ